jgi:hypothetical protein
MFMVTIQFLNVDLPPTLCHWDGTWDFMKKVKSSKGTGHPKIPLGSQVGNEELGCHISSFKRK